MAGYNEILVGRYNRAFQKLLSMKGPAAVNTLSGEIGPTFSLFWGVEMRYLEAWGRFGAQANVAGGGAGTRASFRIDNPKGSNICAVIEKITFNGQAAGTDNPLVNYSIISAGDQANIIVTTNTGLDNRGNQSPSLHVTSQAIVQGLAGVTIHASSLPANAMYDVITYENQELSLMPNSSYTFYSSFLNVGLSGSIWWRERVLEDSELK